MRASDSPLERKRPLLFVIGLLLACTFTLVSFEWRTPYGELVVFERPDGPEIEPIWIPVTLPEPDKKQEKPDSPQDSPTLTFKTVVDLQDGTKETQKLVMADLAAGDPIGFPEEVDVPDEVYGPLDWSAVKPEYCRGDEALSKFLLDNLEYPEIPRSLGITGVVYVQFVVGKNGKVRDAKVLRSVDPWLDGEALRVTKMLDCFTPGRHAGQPVDVYFRLPIRFTLGG
ncbi:MAG: energy transducer TonB [Flavobacteriales bacterium]|jgi:protein TonB|nr:energy transducer TonB [Flavobacteriales bacterium]